MGQQLRCAECSVLGHAGSQDRLHTVHTALFFVVAFALLICFAVILSVIRSTGKRTLRGAMNDGWHSAKRYVLANFRDGRRQDGIDLFAGNYVVLTEGSSPLRQRHPSLHGTVCDCRL